MPAMKERPINLKAWEVRAIREGRKTQTRRVVKGAEKETWQGGECGIRDPCTYWNIGGRAHRCPYGQPGDRLWVRETFLHQSLPGYPPATLYRADGHGDEIGPWKPSVHMPRWASRITLEVVSVRVERLNEISEEDAIAEGIARFDGAWASYDKIMWRYTAPENSFCSLWQSINGPGSWGDQWVWVVEFRRA